MLNNNIKNKLMNMNLKELLSNNLLTQEVFYQMNGYHGQRYCHLSELSDYNVERFDDDRFERFISEVNGFWTDEFVVLVDNEDGEYEEDYSVYSLYEYLNVQIFGADVDESIKESYIDVIVEFSDKISVKTEGFYWHADLKRVELNYEDIAVKYNKARYCQEMHLEQVIHYRSGVMAAICYEIDGDYESNERYEEYKEQLNELNDFIKRTTDALMSDGYYNERIHLKDLSDETCEEIDFEITIEPTVVLNI